MKMEKIVSEIKWEKFRISDICEIHSGQDIYESERVDGEVPYITSTATNNGIKYFVSNYNDSIESNAISVNRNGSVGFAFYHPYAALYSNDCRKLKLKENKNEYVSLFITNQIMQQKGKYNYGYKMGTKRLKSQYILLPVNSEGMPDYVYMKAFISSLISKKIGTYTKFNNEQLTKLENSSLDHPAINDKEFKIYTIGELFNINSGVRLTRNDMLPGKRPFIGSIDSNNGITNFVSNMNKSLDSNTLGVNYNGSVCEVFYHPYECIFSDDVKHLSLKEIQGNIYIYLFIKQMIYQQKIKYTYGYKFNAKRMKKQKILVPVDAYGKPDWEFMEQFIRNIIKRKREEYLEFLKQKTAYSIPH